MPYPYTTRKREFWYFFSLNYRGTFHYKVYTNLFPAMPGVPSYLLLHIFVPYVAC